MMLSPERFWSAFLSSAFIFRQYIFGIHAHTWSGAGALPITRVTKRRATCIHLARRATMMVGRLGGAAQQSKLCDGELVSVIPHNTPADRACRKRRHASCQSKLLRHENALMPPALLLPSPEIQDSSLTGIRTPPPSPNRHNLRDESRHCTYVTRRLQILDPACLCYSP